MTTLWKCSLPGVLLASIALFAGHAYAPAGKRQPYPNEVTGLKMYRRYLAPLRPCVSDHAAVVRVLGPDDALDTARWRIRPRFSRYSLQLESVELTSKQPVSMRQVKFPSAFHHDIAGIAGSSSQFEVWYDSDGLAVLGTCGKYAQWNEGRLGQNRLRAERSVEYRNISRP